MAFIFVSNEINIVAVCDNKDPQHKKLDDAGEDGKEAIKIQEMKPTSKRKRWQKKFYIYLGGK
jgi:hypothetical protein